MAEVKRLIRDKASSRCTMALGTTSLFLLYSYIYSACFICQKSSDMNLKTVPVFVMWLYGKWGFFFLASE